MTPQQLETKLRAHAMKYPESQRAGTEDVSLSVKLPKSRDMAVDLPFAEPTHYALGKHGWVTATIKKGPKPPIDLLLAWIDESFRAVAPKKIVAALDKVSS